MRSGRVDTGSRPLRRASRPPLEAVTGSTGAVGTARENGPAIGLGLSWPVLGLVPVGFACRLRGVAWGEVGAVSCCPAWGCS
jgi:hypothetical protein